MKITHGLLPGQVLQRNAKNRGNALITGSTSVSGTVQICIFKNKKPLRGHAWKVAGESDGKIFCATLADLPVGGPYDVMLRIVNGRAKDEVTVEGIYVGDVWFLAGQSNMQGSGNRINAPKPHPMVRAFYMRDEWDIADEPMHLLAEAVDVVHNQYGAGAGRPTDAALKKIRAEYLKGVSPALAFALDMVKRTGVPQGLVACAHGGTSMAQWAPRGHAPGGASLYGAMMRRYEKLGQAISGILWYQGESDAGAPAVDVYTQRMQELVAASRQDMGLPKLPWLIVQIGCHIARDDGAWNRVQEQQRLLPNVIDHLDVAPAIDLQLDDGIHISGKDQMVLGHRLARLADRLVHGNRKAKGSIFLKKITVDVRALEPGAPVSQVITLTYGNVVGKLQSCGRPNGFMVHASNGEAQDAIYKTHLKGNTVILETQSPLHSLLAGSISYGLGRYPYCNVTDSEGMAIPVMYRVPVGGDDYLPFALAWNVALLKKTGGIAGVTAKQAASLKGWRKGSIENSYVVLPKPLAKNRDGVFVYKTEVTATKAVDMKLLLGADSPFILWLNGKEVCRDAKATNPCTPAEYNKNVRLAEGKNEVLVAFDTRKGMGWGICMRLEGMSDKEPITKIVSYK